MLAILQMLIIDGAVVKYVSQALIKANDTVEKVSGNSMDYCY